MPWLKPRQRRDAVHREWEVGSAVPRQKRARAEAPSSKRRPGINRQQRLLLAIRFLTRQTANRIAPIQPPIGAPGGLIGGPEMPKPNGHPVVGPQGLEFWLTNPPRALRVAGATRRNSRDT